MREQWIRQSDFGFVCHSFTDSNVDAISVFMEQWRRVKDTDDKILSVFVVVRALI